MLENLLRNAGQIGISRTQDAITSLLGPDREGGDIPFYPGRVLLHDLSGIPCLIDLTTLREAVVARGGDPSLVRPMIPVDLIVDHSVQVDVAGRSGALRRNRTLEYSRNRERYTFLRWAQSAFPGVRIVPPGRGIVHQVNLEQLATVVAEAPGPEGDATLMPDTLVGADSHTTMVNALGVLGWGVGGLEAESAMLGDSLPLPAPRVIGVRLEGKLPIGSTATDLVLLVTERLREMGVVGRFLEFYGESLAALSIPDRATISNMAPEYGATSVLFPIDDQVLAYLRLTGRETLVERVDRYAKVQGLFRSGDEEPRFAETIVIRLDQAGPAVAGPERPQDRIPLGDVPMTHRRAFPAPRIGPRPHALPEGAIVIAAITSCTNTSNPGLMVTAGLLARNAVARGLRIPGHVKTSLAPGSLSVPLYLEQAGLMAPLRALGFDVVGYGCTTCAGNSGPLDPWVERALEENVTAGVAVLSGNRNFGGRIHPKVRATYLASPPLVIALALAGTILVDLTLDPVTLDPNGAPASLRDLWPDPAEVERVVAQHVTADVFASAQSDTFTDDERWKALDTAAGSYVWDEHSTYVARPPYLDAARRAPDEIIGARALGILGDSVTTDHISPVGAIQVASPAGRWLREHGVAERDINTYGARRGHHEVMVRGVFDNPSVRNMLVPGISGNATRHFPSGDILTFFDCAERYRSENVPLVLIAGREYGSGSSRDWAAKGVALLGVRAVIARSFERIHRTNLVNTGILPLELAPSEDPAALELSGTEVYRIADLDHLTARGLVRVIVTSSARGERSIETIARIDGAEELETYRHSGLIPLVLDRILVRSSEVDSHV